MMGSDRKAHSKNNPVNSHVGSPLVRRRNDVNRGLSRGKQKGCADALDNTDQVEKWENCQKRHDQKCQAEDDKSAEDQCF